MNSQTLKQQAQGAHGVCTRSSVCIVSLSAWCFCGTTECEQVGLGFLCLFLGLFSFCWFALSNFSVMAFILLYFILLQINKIKIEKNTLSNTHKDTSFSSWTIVILLLKKIDFQVDIQCLCDSRWDQNILRASIPRQKGREGIAQKWKLLLSGLLL